MMNMVVLSWCILKLARGILGVSVSNFESKIFLLESIDDNLLSYVIAISFTLVYVFFDAVPCLLALNGSVANVFHESSTVAFADNE